MFETREHLDRIERKQTHQLQLLYLIFKEIHIMSDATVKLVAEVSALNDAVSAENAVILAAVSQLGKSDDPDVVAATTAIAEAVSNIQSATSTLSAALPAAPVVEPAPVEPAPADVPAAV